MGILKANRSTKPKLSAFAASLLAEWRRLHLPEADQAIVVAVSGGADSTALFLALQELLAAEKLQLKLIVAHLDHGLRASSRQDAKWVAQLAKRFEFDVVRSRANLNTQKEAPENLEQAARNARYQFLLKTARQNHAGYVLTGHTLDDQAETILMRLLRGSAAEGLSGTPVIRSIEPNSTVQLVRPLLSWARRRDTEEYCRSRDIKFLNDEMNDDEAFLRVRVRKQLLPLLESFNKRIVETLSRTADLLNEDASALADDAGRLLAAATEKPGKNNETGAARLSVSVLLQKPAAVRRRALREWIARERGDLKRIEMVHLLAVDKLLSDGRGGRIAQLPGGEMVTRRRGALELSGKKVLKTGASRPKIRGA
ncbi:MAG TPA: tRNA lysidine(34) synthetase TilS [Pyrinomonadaceae bacterium]|jgi:tRNA(Ile)-lysidine synthase